MIPRVNLVTYDVPVTSPQGIVYSRHPYRAESEEETYFVKNTDPEVVFAEIVGCALAREVELPVPDVAACAWEDMTYAGSAWVKDSLRDISPLMRRPEVITNFEDLFNAVVVDVWLANTDRNFGNVVGRPQGGGKVELVFIDFEKSVALRRHPTISSSMIAARSLWPSEELGAEMRARKPMHPPADMIARISSLSPHRCGEVIEQAVAAIGSPVDWAGDSAGALVHRATRIQRLAEEVWATI